MLRWTDAQVFKRYSQMKLPIKREALQKLNGEAGEAKSAEEFGYGAHTGDGVLTRSWCGRTVREPSRVAGRTN